MSSRSTQPSDDGDRPSAAAPPVGRPIFAYAFERFPTYTQTFCVREVQEVSAPGFTPAVFSIRDTRDEPPNICPPELWERVEYLPRPEVLRAWVEDKKGARELPQAAVLTLRRWGDRPDKNRVYEGIYLGHQLRAAGIAHAHSHFAGIGARALWWARKFYGISYSFTGHANDIFRPEDEDFPLPLRLLMRDATGIVTVSDFSAKDFRTRFPGAAPKVERIYNGLDLAPFQQPGDRRPPGMGSRTILSVGRLIEKKGFPDLISACRILQKQGVDDFSCQIIGDGPLRPQLEAQIEQSGLGGCVELLGEREIPEIAERLRERTQVFALPCIVESDGGMDNLPTVIMEAMAASVPCVSTRLAGVPEMVIDGETGTLVDPGDTEALAAALASLLDDPDRCAAWGKAGAARAAELFDKAITARQLRQFLTLRGRPRPSLRAFLDDPALCGSWLRSLPRRIGRFLRPPRRKVRDKGFDIASFVERT